jgi:DAK2 domain fusion protein YloV
MQLEVVRHLARSALQNLEVHRQRVDDLNVYPVPDGDTGTNLVLTLRSIVEALDASTAVRSEEVARDVTRAALMGARGNSGVIFSQIVRGFVDVLGRSENITTPLLKRAFRGASDAAYRAVKRPVEGTMLTVVREMAEEAERKENRKLGPGELLTVVLARSEDALARTPDMLDVLKKAGVVDAGGAGLVEIARGLAYGATGQAIPEVPIEAESLALEAIHQETSRYRYCTVFLVEGTGLDQPWLESELERIGDSLLVVGDASALKVHVHTDEPGVALSFGTRLGVVEGVEIANMHHQAAQREERLLEGVAAIDLSALEVGVVAVCPGRGNRRLFESLGAIRVIEGGQTMNPAASEILEAVEATPTNQVIILPNNSNVVLTAEQAAALTAKTVHLVPSKSVQAGLAAMMRYVPTNSPEENVETMLDALTSVSTGEVTVASRDAELDGITIREGEYFGLVDDRAVACDAEVETVVRAVVERVLEGDRELLSILTGEGAPPLQGLVEGLQRDHPELIVDVHDGGQPHYPLLVVAE